MEVKGHVKSRNRLTQALKDSADRAHLLTDLSDIRGSGPILQKILHSQGIDNNVLAIFRMNIMRAKRLFGSRFEDGITAQDAINISQRQPLRYRTKQRGRYVNDLEKAKFEIKRAIPASMVKGECRFITTASYGSPARQHYVTIRFNGWQQAIEDVQSGKKTPRQAANAMRKGRLKMHCTCKRWNFFFSYLATIGGYNCGPAQRGYPKIRNRNLQGCCCKHALRTLAEVNSSTFMLGFFERALQNYAQKGKATKATAQDVQNAQKIRTQSIKTSDQKAAENRRRREAEAVRRARDADRKKAEQPKEIAPHAKRMRAKDALSAAKELARMFGMKAQDILTAITEWKSKH